MALAVADTGRVHLSALRPPSMPGVTVARFTRQSGLARAVPSHFGTVLHQTGRAEWSVRRTRWMTGPGSVGVKIPGELYVQRTSHGISRFQVALFDPALVDDAREALERQLVAPEDSAVDPRDGRLTTLRRFHRALLDDVAAEALEQHLCDALAALVELTSAPRGTRFSSASWSPAVARARALLDERLTETVTLDELAAHARLDKYRLCRAFRDEVGLPPYAYVTHRRVGRAQELLARGLCQAEVALRVGLYDQSQLHRHFKRIVGLTPGDFARAIR